jgi:rubrerythrin
MNAATARTSRTTKKPVGRKVASTRKASSGVGKKSTLAKPVPWKKAKAAAAPKARAVAAPRTLSEFMAQAWLMEIEAAQRYEEFADAMEMHNNRDVATLFRTMAGYETKHADAIMAEMGWTEAPPLTPRSSDWPGTEGPETAPGDAVHYLMQPWHALTLALAAERRAEQFFVDLARAAKSDSVRRAALELAAEEREHVALVLKWMKKVPPPDSDWSHDPDPPRNMD